MGDRGLAVGVLGPMLVSVGDRHLTVSAGRLRAMLVVLAMSAGEGVSVDRLVGAVWGEDLPSDPRRTVRTYLTRLRRILGPAAFDSVPDGYRLLVAPDRVDAIRFVRLLDAAARAGDPGTERCRLAQALALWRGTPFTGVPSPWLREVEATRLVERRLSALERRVDLDLGLGEDTQELVAELRALIARHPLRERLWGQLMTALYRSSRQADALAAYRLLYRTLDEELGLQPCAAIRELHRRILNRDPALDPLPGSGTAARYGGCSVACRWQAVSDMEAPDRGEHDVTVVPSLFTRG
jgi:DNA-binding SARP family transcriptional activator